MNDLDTQVEALLEACQRRGDAEGSEVEVGDLQSLIWSAWRLLSLDQRLALVSGEAAAAIRDMDADS